MASGMRIRALNSVVLILASCFVGIALAQQPKTETTIKSPAPAAKDSSLKDPVKDPLKRPANQPEKTPGGKPMKPAGDPFSLTPEREAAAMTFVKQHHPELAELVSVLKESRPKEYHKAIRDLYRASEQLANLHEADLQRYNLELKAWRIQSRVQLLVARVQMAPTDEKLTSELKAELSQQVDVRLEILELERQRLSERAGRLDSQIDKLKLSRDSHVERQLSELIHKGRPSKVGKPAKKPMANP